jgi:hypothetical protein
MKALVKNKGALIRFRPELFSKRKSSKKQYSSRFFEGIFGGIFKD